jgi:glycerol kinase
VSRELLLALDLGTTGVRALLIQPDGAVLSRAYRPLSMSHPKPGHVEQDPDEMWDASLDVLRRCLSTAACSARDVAGIGVVTQRSTALAWDGETGRPLAKAIGWQDTRTAPRVAGFRKMGVPLNTLATATKFEWWIQNEPAVRESAERGTLRLGTPDTWLTYRLTGGARHVTDPGNASCTALYDLASGEWAPTVLSIFSVPEGALPEVVPTAEVIGDTPASLLGAPIQVAARAGDQQAATFAQGVHAPGESKLTLGTSAMLDRHTGSEPAETSPGVYALALWKLSDGSRAFCVEGTVITAGAAVDWLVDLGLLVDAAELDTIAGSVPAAEGVTFVPALQGLGTPFLEDGARGLIGGLTRGTRAAHVVRATLDGVAHRCIDVCRAVGATDGPLRVDGGLAQSGLLLQTIADLLGQEVWRSAEVEATAVGGAYLAGLAVKAFEDPAACRATLPLPTHFVPTMEENVREEARARWARATERAREKEG